MPIPDPDILILRETPRHCCAGRMSCLVFNQVGQRSTIRCSSSLCIWRLLPAGLRFGVPHESRRGKGGFQILCSSHMKLDGFNYIGDPNFASVLKC